MRKSGFLQAATQRDTKSLAKLQIPGLFPCKTAARRVRNCGGLGPMAASQLEEKRRTQRHALARRRSPPSIYQRNRCGGVTDADQEDCVRPAEVTVSWKERIGFLIFAPCARGV